MNEDTNRQRERRADSEASEERGLRVVSSGVGDNLPLPLTSFVGREAEIKEVRGMVRGGRLVSLVGVGGSGKTRLAVEAARSFSGGEFPDGVWLVELDSLREPSLVAREAASILGVSERPGREMERELPNALGESRRLIVLDNCEHLAEACAELCAALLRRCPNLAILATSREPLGVPGEGVWPVPALSVPDSHSLAAASRSESARLFAERASAASFGFALTEENAPAVSEVCRRLDGAPLAIELAASRVRSMTVAQISARLDDALALLAAGPRTAPTRHATLRATMDWSHALLDEAEQRLFRNLSVFSGGFTLEAAEKVCESEASILDLSILDLLSRLVDKSLVRARREGEAARYRFPEVIRQYAVEKLEGSGEADAMRERHAVFFRDFAEEAERQIEGSEWKLWLALVDEDLDNFRAAMSWAANSGDVDLCLNVCVCLAWFWLRRGRLVEGRAAIGRALGAGEGSELAVAKALHVVGGLAWAQGDRGAARSYLGEAVARFRKLDDYEWRYVWLSSALSTYSLELMSHGETGEALAAAEESVDLVREIWDVRGIGESPVRARALAALGLARMAVGNFEEAKAPLEESAALCRRIGDGWLLSFPLGNLAAMSLMAGDHEKALALAEESIRALRDLGEKWLLSVSLSYLAATLAASGRDRRAATLFGAGEAMREDVGQEEVYAHYRAIHDRGVEAARNVLGEEGFSAAWAEGRAMDVEAAISFALEEDEPSVPTLRVYALGRPRVEVGGDAVEASDWKYAKVAELFFYLMSHGPATRAGIGLELWPDASPGRLRNAFHTAMLRLRKAIGPPNRVHFTSGRYAFDDTAPHTFDARDFEEKIRRARQLAEEEPDSAITLLEEAAELYRGDFLEGFSGGEWILFRQQELREAHIEGQILLGRLLARLDKHPEAARAFRRAIARDPYSAEAHAGLIRAYSHLGERGRALRHYEELEDIFREDLGATPPPEVAALVERVRRGEEL